MSKKYILQMKYKDIGCNKRLKEGFPDFFNWKTILRSEDKNKIIKRYLFHINNKLKPPINYQVIEQTEKVILP